MDPGTDRTVLRQQYATADNLDTRRAFYDYKEPQHDFPAILAGLIEGAPGPVLDVGCGPGHYTTHLRSLGRADVVGLDLSAGMRPDAVGDAARLPIATDAVGSALALHMLYHLPDPAEGLRELRRVTRRGGRVVVLTNDADHLREFRQLVDEAAGRHIHWAGETFDSDQQPLVESILGPVEVVPVAGEVRLPDPGPLVAFLQSLRTFYEGQLDCTWDEMVDRFTALATARPELTVRARTSWFVAG